MKTHSARIHLMLMTLFSLVIHSQPLSSQTLWGVSGENDGAIYKYDIAKQEFTQAHLFTKQFASTSPTGAPALFTDGKFYLPSTDGGVQNLGAIYCFNPMDSTIQLIYSFKGECTKPVGGLTLGHDSLLYGISAASETNGWGTIYCFDPSNDSVHVISSLEQEFDLYTTSSPFISFDNKLYGYYNDAIFKCDLETGQLSILHTFSDIEQGGIPVGRIDMDTDGILYGTCYTGGSFQKGVLFSLNASSNEYQVLLNFGPEYGGTPFSGIVCGSDSILYGMTHTYQHGLLYSFDPRSSQFTAIDSCSISALHYGQCLHENEDGKIYYAGGSNANQVKGFNLQTHSKEIYFESNDLPHLFNSITVTPQGDFLDYSFQTNDIILSLLHPAENTHISLLCFKRYESNGYNPSGGLLKGNDNFLYGLANKGGFYDSGVLYRMDTLGNNYEALYSFKRTDLIGNPVGIDSMIYMMGRTEQFLTCIFGYNTNQHTIDTLLRWINCSMPTLYEGIGNTLLFVDTEILKAYNLTDHLVTTISSLPTMSGYGTGAFYQEPDGTVFGTCQNCGSYEIGGIFKVHEGNTCSFMYICNPLEPIRGLRNTFFRDEEGRLVGSSAYSGYPGYIFTIDANSNEINKVFEFNDDSGLYPGSDLVKSQHHLAFGTTGNGGQYDKGTIYSYDDVTFEVNKLFDLKDASGYFPDYGRFLLLNDFPLGTSELANPVQARIYPNPVSSGFTIETEGTTSSRITIRISDNLGRILKNECLENTDRQFIDISGFRPGIYTLMLLSPEGKTVKKIVKN